MDSIVHEAYLDKSYMQRVRTAANVNRFKTASLTEFFSKEIYKKLVAQIKHLNYKEIRVPNWKNLKEASVSNGMNLVFNSEEVLTLLSHLLDKKVKEVKLKAVYLSWKSYKILNDQHIEEPGIDIVFDLSPQDWDPRFGGSIVFVDGEGNYEEIPASPNTLSVATRKKSDQKFIQYANNLSKGIKRYILIGKVI